MQAMVLQSLILCRDPGTLRVSRRALDDLGIAVEVATTAESALERLDRNKFDAIIVDCDDVAGGAEVLAGVQQSPSNKRAIVIAVINGATNMRAAFEMGAHFALDKPVTLERAVRSLRAAHGFMITEQRRYFRHAVEAKAYLTFGVVKQLPCHVTNISDGGMAVALSEQISPSWAVEVRFGLPGIPETLEVKGEFAWSDGKGNAGIRFIYISSESKKALGKWLAERIEDVEARGPGKGSGRHSLAI
ncbi:MAG: PilZ domain-containing protein [Terriglobales bacterium]